MHLLRYKEPTKTKDQQTMTDLSNSALSAEEIADVSARTADALAGVMGAEAKIDKTRESGQSLRKKAAAEVFPLLERIGVEANWGKDFAANAKKISSYESLRIAVCEAVSRKVNDLVEPSAIRRDGTAQAPRFTVRINKAWSRLMTSYREGGEGGSTKADDAARAAAKERSKTSVAKADMLDGIIEAAATGDVDRTEALIAASLARWPHANTNTQEA